MSKKEVIQTLRDEIDDIGIMASVGGTALRQNRIQRICEEALEQDGILSQEDLSLLLDESTRTTG